MLTNVACGGHLTRLVSYDLHSPTCPTHPCRSALCQPALMPRACKYDISICPLPLDQRSAAAADVSKACGWVYRGAGGGHGWCQAWQSGLRQPPPPECSHGRREGAWGCSASSGRPCSAFGKLRKYGDWCSWGGADLMSHRKSQRNKRMRVSGRCAHMLLCCCAARAGSGSPQGWRWGAARGIVRRRPPREAPPAVGPALTDIKR